MEKNPGGKKFWQRGGGEISWNSILPPKMRVAPQMPPQIPRPDAATVYQVIETHPLLTIMR